MRTYIFKISDQYLKSLILFEENMTFLENQQKINKYNGVHCMMVYGLCYYYTIFKLEKQ